MFGRRFFGRRFFGAHYFGPADNGSVATVILPPRSRTIYAGRRR